jgi:ABC-2 type transport system ATP-binding protein
MKQRLGVAAALLPNPELCILDEPTNGLDPAGIREMRSVIRGLADRGITVFVSSHLLAEIEAICDHLVMIDCGRIVFQGGVDKLIGTQQSEIVATPEHPADAPALAALCIAAGRPARVAGNDVRVQAPEEWAPELNRQAMAGGITLRALAVDRASLEQAYFAITEGPQDQA